MLTLGPDSFEQLEPKLREFFCLPADQQCKIYYCTDRKQPRATRIEVNATSWHTFWLSVKAHKDTWLVMHAAPASSWLPRKRSALVKGARPRDTG